MKRAGSSMRSLQPDHHFRQLFEIRSGAGRTPMVPHLHNWGGRIGTAVDLMLFVFGASAWWWCALLLRTLWQGYRRFTAFLVKNCERASPGGPDPRRRFALILVGSMGIEYTRMSSLHMQLPQAPGGVLGADDRRQRANRHRLPGPPCSLLLLFRTGHQPVFHVSLADGGQACTSAPASRTTCCG